MPAVRFAPGQRAATHRCSASVARYIADCAGDKSGHEAELLRKLKAVAAFGFAQVHGHAAACHGDAPPFMAKSGA